MTKTKIEVMTAMTAYEYHDYFMEKYPQHYFKITEILKYLNTGKDILFYTENYRSKGY